MKTYTLQELADKLEARLVGDASLEVSGLATLQSATGTELSFLANPAYQKYLGPTAAGAVLLTETMLEECQTNALVVDDPYLAYAELSLLWSPNLRPENAETNIHESAVIDPSAKIASSAVISAGVVIAAGVEICEGAYIGANTYIGNDSVIGQDSLIYAGVNIYHGVSVGEKCIIHSGVVIGSDGFGIAPTKNGWQKIAQLGGVVIEDDVEIGANSAIDRGALDNTVIESGVKLDNQIQIAHNVRVGQNTAIAACSAIAGSTVIGKNCVIGGASGIAGHLTVADNVHITAMTMVIKSLTEPGVYSSGTGVQPNAKWRKSIARLRQLDKMASRIKALEQAQKS